MGNIFLGTFLKFPSFKIINYYFECSFQIYNLDFSRQDGIVKPGFKKHSLLHGSINYRKPSKEKVRKIMQYLYLDSILPKQIVLI